jgi:hypothetical protein
VLAVGAAPFLAAAADHLDAPIVKTEHALDLTDIYAFDAANTGSTVLVANVNPLAGVISGLTFSVGADRYRLNVDKNGDFDAADAVDDVYTLTFGPIGGRDRKQPVTLERDGATIAQGWTGNTIQVAGGGRLFAGVRDDPFYFDLAGYNKLKDSGYTDTSGLTNAGVDFFAGTNVSSIVLELPDWRIGASADYWATTYKNGTLIDRMGKPALNTVFVDPFKVDDTAKDDYNQTAPAADPATWGPLFEAVLEFFGNPPELADTIRGLLLPDVLHVDTANLGKATGTSFTGDKAGVILNGRTLAEDVIDFELFVVTGGLRTPSSPILTTDHVDSNDAAIMSSFPYLAPRH